MAKVITRMECLWGSLSGCKYMEGLEKHTVIVNLSTDMYS